jgi:hypothetical protein
MIHSIDYNNNNDQDEGLHQWRSQEFLSILIIDLTKKTVGWQLVAFQKIFGQ